MSGGSSSLSCGGERRRRQSRVQLEVRDLAQRVDARVGPAGAVELERGLRRDGADRAVDLALDGAGVLLDLPAGVARAGVLDQQLEAGHGAD